MTLHVIASLENLSRITIHLFQQQIFYSIFLFIIVAVVSSTTRKLSPRWHHVLWLLILIRLVLPPDFSHPLSGRYLLDQIPAIHKVFDWLSLQFNKSSIDAGEKLRGFSIDDLSIHSQKNASLKNPDTSKNSIFYVALFLTWFSGCMLYASIYIRRFLQFNRMIRQSRHVGDSSSINLLNFWRMKFHIRRHVRIVSSDAYLSPFTSGIFRPVIYIPQCVVMQHDLNLLESIIAHEMAHIKRFDDVWIKVQNLIQIIYFFHPIVWFANSKINLSRECICDSMVLSTHTIAAPIYGKGLMTVLKLNLFGSKGIELLPALGSPRSKIRYRIQNLKGVHTMNKSQISLLYGLILLFGLFILPMSKSGIVSKAGMNSSQIIAAELVAENETTFELPVKEGNLTANFGNMQHPYTKKTYFHTGIDIAAPMGAQVFAAAAGTIAEAVNEFKENDGPGKYIVIQHANGYTTRYTHLQQILVTQGQQVSAGQVVASIGITGLSTGPHLHFEILHNDKPMNPKEYLKIEKLMALKNTKSKSNL